MKNAYVGAAVCIYSKYDMQPCKIGQSNEPNSTKPNSYYQWDWKYDPITGEKLHLVYEDRPSTNWDYVIDYFTNIEAHTASGNDTEYPLKEQLSFKPEFKNLKNHLLIDKVHNVGDVYHTSNSGGYLVLDSVYEVPTLDLRESSNPETILIPNVNSNCWVNNPYHSGNSYDEYGIVLSASALDKCGSEFNHTYDDLLRIFDELNISYEVKIISVKIQQ